MKTDIFSSWFGGSFILAKRILITITKRVFYVLLSTNDGIVSRDKPFLSSNSDLTRGSARGDPSVAGEIFLIFD